MRTPEQLIAAIDDTLTNQQPLPAEILQDIRAEIAKTLPAAPWIRIDEAAKQAGEFMYETADRRVSICKWKKTKWYDTVDKCECWPVFYLPPQFQTKQQRKLAMEILLACYA